MKRPALQVNIVDPGPLTDAQIATYLVLHGQLLASLLVKEGATLGTPAVGIDGLPHDILHAAIGGKKK